MLQTNKHVVEIGTRDNAHELEFFEANSKKMNISFKKTAAVHHHADFIFHTFFTTGVKTLVKNSFQKLFKSKFKN